MWRLATPAEDDAIVAMCRDLNQEDAGPAPVPEAHVRRTLAAVRAEPARGRVVILEIDGRPEGYALLMAFWSNELGGEICTIDELYVRPPHRSRGHARALVLSIVEGGPPWARRPVAIELEVTPANARALSLYERLGFAAKRNRCLRLAVKRAD